MTARCALATIALAVAMAAPAHAAFPGANGKIAFGTDRDGNEEIYSMTAAGGSQTNLTNNPGGTALPLGRPTARRSRSARFAPVRRARATRSTA